MLGLVEVYVESSSGFEHACMYESPKKANVTVGHVFCKNFLLFININYSNLICIFSILTNNKLFNILLTYLFIEIYDKNICRSGY